MLSPTISHPGTAGAYCDYLLPLRLVTLYGPLPWRHTYYRAINAYLDALRVPIYLRVGVFDSLLRHLWCSRACPISMLYVVTMQNNLSGGCPSALTRRVFFRVLRHLWVWGGPVVGFEANWGL